MAPEVKPGWYVRNDMFRTLGFWDGKGWTEQTAPSYDDIKTSVGTVAGGVFLGTLLLLVIGSFLGAFLGAFINL